MSEGGVDPLRMGGAAVLAVLLAAGPYGVSMFMPDSGSFGISEVELKEDSDEISFRVIGSANSVDAVITADGVEKWSSSTRNFLLNLHGSQFQSQKSLLGMHGNATLVVVQRLL